MQKKTVNYYTFQVCLNASFGITYMVWWICEDAFGILLWVFGTFGGEKLCVCEISKTPKTQNTQSGLTRRLSLVEPTYNTEPGAALQDLTSLCKFQNLIKRENSPLRLYQIPKYFADMSVTTTL